MNIPDRIVTNVELRRGTGERGAPKLIAFNGIVYDVTDCPKWPTDMHEQLHFPGEDLTDAQHVATVAIFGPVAEEARGTVTFVSNPRPAGALGSSAASFHVAFGFFPRPYEAISLYGLEVPAGGAETCRSCPHRC